MFVFVPPKLMIQLRSSVLSHICILFTSPQITRAGHASVSRYTVSSSASAGDTRISPGTYSYIHVTQHVACISSSVKFSVHVNKPLCRYQSWSSVKVLNALAELGVRLQNNVASRACASFSNGVASRAIAYF